MYNSFKSALEWPILAYFMTHPTRPWLFCEVGIQVILVAFDSFRQLPLSIWLISTIKWDTLKCRIDAWVRIFKLSFLYQSFETVLVARYWKVFLKIFPYLITVPVLYSLSGERPSFDFDIISFLPNEDVVFFFFATLSGAFWQVTERNQ